MVSESFLRHLEALQDEYAKLEAENSGLRTLAAQVRGHSSFETSLRDTNASLSTLDPAAVHCPATTHSALLDSPASIEARLPGRIFQEDGVHAAWDEGEAAAGRTVVAPPARKSFFRKSMSGLAHINYQEDDDEITSEMSDRPMLRRRTTRKQVFPNADDMKERVRKQMMQRKYEVTGYYKTEGCSQSIGRNPIFENVTLAVVAFNAIWIAIDTDWNTEDVLYKAHPVFQIAEHFFCFFFLIELLIRFDAFADKRNCMKDAWFIFDSCLVVMMVLETWVMTAIIAATAGTSGGKLGDASILRIVRPLRLTRMARMAKLLRAVPELLILLKGVAAAARSVFFTLLLLMVLTYVFAIAFRRILDKTPTGKEHFANVAMSMHSLWLYGTLVDEITSMMEKLEEDSYICVVLMDLFILVASLTVMNMLIGVLCEVVGAVAAAEKEELNLNYVKRKVESIFSRLGLDADNDGKISKDEFVKIIENREAAQAISDLGVDVVELVDMADILFATDAEDTELQKEFSLPDFMDVVMELRGSNAATVKHIMNLQKFIASAMGKIDEKIQRSTDGAIQEISRKSTLALGGGFPNMPKVLTRRGSTGSVSELRDSGSAHNGQDAVVAVVLTPRSGEPPSVVIEDVWC